MDAETIEMYRRGLDPTPEELKRVFTKDEFAKICKHFKLRVDIFRYNPFNDYVTGYMKKERYANKSKKEILRLAAKGVNRFKHKCLYPEEECRNIEQKARERQKKIAILYLDYLELLKSKDNANNSDTIVIPESASSEELQQKQIYANIEDDNSSEYVEYHNDIESTPDIMPVEENNNNYLQRNAIKINGKIFSDNILIDDRATKQQQSTEETVTNSVYTHEASLINQIGQFNTESMTISSQSMQIVSEPLSEVAPFESQLTPYDNFQTFVPATSTQDSEPIST